MLCRFAALPNRTVGGVKVAGDIRAYYRMCESKDEGDHCEKDTKDNHDRENCYSFCRKDYCNTINGDLDPREFFDDGEDTTTDSPNLSTAEPEVTTVTDTAEIDGPRRNDTAALGGSVTAAGTLVGLGAAVALVHAWP